jgi:YD repeat-containing protein
MGMLSLRAAVAPVERLPFRGQGDPEMKFPPILSLFALCLLIHAMKAEVSLKNGNYFMGNTDISFPGGFELKIERVYNSKTSFKGLFGQGWGNGYEVYLTVAGDGSALVHEYGGGADNRFDSPGLSADQVAKVADQILEAAQSRGDVTGAANLEAFRTKLIGDVYVRQKYWDDYVGKGLLQPRIIPVGTKLLSTRFSYQNITVTSDGYRRDFDNGRIEFFRKDGKLRQVGDKNGNFISFNYAVPGQIVMSDNYQRSLALTKNDRGLVTRIEGSDGRTCSYRYNDLDELVYVEDAAGDIYTYEYDSLKRHNMTKSTFPDKTTQLIDYYPREEFENVKSIVDRDGTLTEYAYNIDPNNGHHLTVSVKVSGSSNADGKRPVISTSSYEYFELVKTSGETYTFRMVTTIDGDRTETTYNLDGLPTRIERGKEVTSFVYDDKGHVTHKETSNEITVLTYDPAVSKVTSVHVTEKPSGKLLSDSHFTYDTKGNLLNATSGATTIKLQYDSRGRIQRLDPSAGGSIQFDYNQNSKPVKITVLAHGDEDGKSIPEMSIDVEYTEDGQIEKVDSTAGRAAALQVTSAFQNLLDVIRPAGVSLSF